MTWVAVILSIVCIYQWLILAGQRQSIAWLRRDNDKLSNAIIEIKAREWRQR